MKNGKAAAEVYKLGGEYLTRSLHQLIVEIWKAEEIPPDFRDAIIVTIFKKCGNYRGISLLSIAGKIITRILAQRLLLPLSL